MLFCCTEGFCNLDQVLMNISNICNIFDILIKCLSLNNIGLELKTNIICSVGSTNKYMDIRFIK